MPTIDDLKQMFSREHTSFDTWSHSRGGGTSSSPPPRGSLTQSPRAGHDTRGGGGGAAGPPLRSSLSPPATVHEDDEEGVEFPALNDGAYAVQDLRAYRRSWDSDQNFPIKEIERIKKKTKKLRSSREPIFRSDDFENHEAKAAAFAAIAHEPTRNNSGSLSHDGSSVRHRRTVRTLTSGSSKTRDTLAEVLDMDLSTTDGDMSEDVKQVSPEPSPKPVEPRAAVVEPSPRAHEAKQALMMGFHKRGRHRSTDESSNGVFNTSVRTEETNTTDDNASKDLALHDLVGEAVTVDDIAWRNALHLLSVEPHLAFVSDHGWTPLHICCIGSSPPPTFMVRALLYTNKAASKQPDEGGRLPLHLIAASSADVDTMQLLVEEHPEALHQTDEHGLTPLHLLLRNLQVSLTVDRARILLGLTLPRSMDEQVRQRSVLLRRRDHLNMGFEELGRMLHKTPPVTTFRKDVDHEMNFDKYPSDIQTALRRLSQWKRKQHFVDDSAELEVPLTGGETNPAAIPSPGNLHLPIHALVRRALVDRPLLEPHASRRVQYDGEGKDEEVYDQEVRSEAEQVPIKNPYDLLRMFVASYPEGLVVRDNDGYTPLMLLMMESDTLPSLDVLDVLLGKRTAGYESIPSWAQDLPLHRLSTHHSVNPAMVPTVESQSLPLHVAAEELLVDDSLIRTIYESYPGAIQVQDALGRTPLHIALRSYRKIPANPQVMELLYSDHVAKIRDDHSRIPFDLLLESAQNLPEKRPASWSDTKSGSSASTVYQRFISASVADTKPSNRKEAVRFLRRLRLLPPWLRKEACASSVVQDLLVEDLASPVKCALILLDGILLVALITVFRVQLESYVDALNKDDVLATWYTFAVYGIATTRLLLEVAFWMAAASFGEFQHLFLFNIWTWIGAGAMLLAIIASVLIFGSLEENHVFAIGTAATGLLWLNLLGYLTTWSHGVSLFVGGLAKISCFLVWPLVLFGCFAVAFAQMFYSLLQINCAGSIPITPVCTVRDSYRVVYLLIRGDALTDIEGVEQMSFGAIFLIGIFLIALLLFILGLLVIVFVAAARLDFEAIALEYFWEPKLALQFSAIEFGMTTANSNEKKHSTSRSLSRKLEAAWELLILSLFGGNTRSRKHWYARVPDNNLWAWPLWLFAIVAVPIWIVLGAVTLGLLWPPQLRRLVFRPVGTSWEQRQAKNTAERTERQVRSVREDVMQLKVLSLEQSENVERELHDLKAMLYSAMKEA